MYERLAGMTGTAITEAHEFKEIYKLEVLQIPTHKKCIRDDFNDEMYMTEREKFQSLLQEIRVAHEKGRPLLIGTESVEVSEKLSRLLKMNRLEHTVLNAKNHSQEAAIVACAGHKGAITVATNMAGRGTDIKLEPGVAELGGLYVIGSTRHNSRRIDRQLRGRGGRQGDPGSSKFYVSLEDPLMRLFATPALTGWLQRFRPPEGEPIAAPILNKSIETAQKRIETRNYTIRKHTLEYDDVMNHQRQEIYRYRNDILHEAKPSEIALEVVEGLFDSAVARYGEKNDWEGLRDFLMTCIPMPIAEEKIDAIRRNKVALQEFLQSDIKKAFLDKLNAEKESITRSFPIPEEEAKKIIEETIRSILLRIVDSLWQRHLLDMDHLRTDVSIRAVGQKDPLMEFKYEAFALFATLTMKLREESVRSFFHFTLMAQRREEEEYTATPQTVSLEQDRSFLSDFHEGDEMQVQNGDDLPATIPLTPIHVDDKIGRNEGCPCGSGKKHKKCCGGKEL
jgi:preprotein translocase subunit SecA